MERSTSGICKVERSCKYSKDIIVCAFQSMSNSESHVHLTDVVLAVDVSI